MSNPLARAAGGVPEWGSPAWVISRLREARSRVELAMTAFFTDNPRQVKLLLTALIFCLAWYLAAIGLALISPQLVWTEGRLVVAFPAFTLCGLAGILLIQLASAKWFYPLYAGVQLAAILLCALLFGAGWLVISVFICLTLLMFICAFAAFRLQSRFRWSSNTIFLGCFIVACALAFLQFGEHQLEHDRLFYKIYTAFRWILVIAFPVFAAGLTPGPVLDRQFKNYILFPLGFLYPLPTRLGFWERVADRRLMSRGILDVASGLLFLGVVFMHRYLITALPAYKASGGFLATGVVSYYYTYFRSAAIITIPVGLARCAGFALPDPYNFPLLANTPQERWRRWNTYFYDLFIVAIFHPVFKYTKSIFLGVFCVFFFTALTHGSVGNLLLDQTDTVGSFGLETTWFFFLHACFVYLGLKTERFWPLMSRRRGWIGVLVTTMMMSAIHFLKLSG